MNNLKKVAGELLSAEEMKTITGGTGGGSGGSGGGAGGGANLCSNMTCPITGHEGDPCGSNGDGTCHCNDGHGQSQYCS